MTKVYFLIFSLVLLGCNIQSKDQRNSKKEHKTKLGEVVFCDEVLEEIEKSRYAGKSMLVTKVYNRNGRLRWQDIDVGDTIYIKFDFKSEKKEIINEKTSLSAKREASKCFSVN